VLTRSARDCGWGDSEEEEEEEEGEEEEEEEGSTVKRSE
jgi:hypothetical protein